MKFSLDFFGTKFFPRLFRYQFFSRSVPTLSKVPGRLIPRPKSKGLGTNRKAKTKARNICPIWVKREVPVETLWWRLHKMIIWTAGQLRYLMMLVRWGGAEAFRNVGGCGLPWTYCTLTIHIYILYIYIVLSLFTIHYTAQLQLRTLLLQLQIRSLLKISTKLSQARVAKLLNSRLCYEVPARLRQDE